MHIDSIQLYRVPLKRNELDAGGPLESIFVAMRSAGGVGWGEVSLGCAPREQQEFSAGAFACLRDWLAPALVDQNISSGEKLQELLRPFRGNSFAKSALDIAWWNLAAAGQSKALPELLGGAAGPAPLSAMIGERESMEGFLREIGQAFELGYDHVVLKFRPGWDVQMLRAVRQAFAAEPIAIDCDGGCTLGLQEMFYRLEDFFLKYIEQPLPADDLVGHAMLQQSLRTPIALDQSIHSLARLEQAIDLESCRQVTIEIGNVGGITPAVAIRAACKAAEVPVRVGGGPQSAVAAHAAASCASAWKCCISNEAFRWQLESWLLLDDTAYNEARPDGKLALRIPNDVSGPMPIDVQRLAEHAVDRASIG